MSATPKVVRTTAHDVWKGHLSGRGLFDETGANRAVVIAAAEDFDAMVTELERLRSHGAFMAKSNQVRSLAARLESARELLTAIELSAPTTVTTLALQSRIDAWLAEDAKGGGE